MRPDMPRLQHFVTICHTGHTVCHPPAAIYETMHNETAFSRLQVPVPAPTAKDLFRQGMDYLRDRWPLGHSLPVPLHFLQKASSQCDSPPWHVEAVARRNPRRHVCIPCGWIARYLPKNTPVFEPGCGSGANLLWLALKGFTHLSGSDIDPRVLHFSEHLQKYMGHSLETWQDNALSPARLPENQGAILSVNWLYHLPGTSLDAFMETYRPCLKPAGFFVFDVISDRYNGVANNEYHTEDWRKPRHLRRPSEYTFRLSHEDVERLAHRHGFRVLRRTRIHSRPQRCAYILGRAAL